jgi:hypothetical protein
MDNGVVLAKQCSLIKARNPHIKCNVYRNTVIALNQFRHVSKVLDDPAYAGTYWGVAANNVCTNDIAQLLTI